MKASGCVLLLTLLPQTAGAADVDYVRDVKPVLARHCLSCHGPDKQRSGLRLDSPAAILQGGDAGPAVLPGKSKDSRLLQAVTGTGDAKPMPPKGPRLSEPEIAVLRAWIDAGARGPAGAAEEVASKHWAFQPVVRPSPPAVKNAAWVRNPIDRFILPRLEKEGVSPSPEADRVTLLRRVSFDLIGLPPSPREVAEFLADNRPDAYERVVERLLASPHYGERWGRHWLDLARYADSNGYSIDAPRSIWKYRDWVIAAFNRDLPFDRFTIEQIAGDLLPNPTREQQIATGFHRNTQINQEGGIDLEQFRVESIVDRVNTTGTAWLGLTIGCCQCHDHKFDPLSQKEYYRFFAFFNSVDEPTLPLPTPEQERQRREIQGRLTELERQLQTVDTTSPQRIADWEGKLDARTKAMLPEKLQAILAIAVNGRDARQEAQVIAAYRRFDQTRHVVGGLGGPTNLLMAAHVYTLGRRLDYEKQIAALKKQEPTIPTTMVVRELKTPRPTNVMLGGDFLRKGAAVTPGTFAVLPPIQKDEGGRRKDEKRRRENDSDSSFRVLPPSSFPTRLDLARWLVDPRNPLPARVTVNRFWQHFFGLGLVETENDFGTQGTPPSHPELLDWLASEFVARGWSMKSMHRLLVTSATYRQASRTRPELVTLDPRNRLLARQARVRLDAEIVRDAALTASGLLTRTVGGPSVFPPQPAGVYHFTQVPRDWKASTGPDRYRRGLYTFFWRSAPHPGLTVFDAPDALATCTRRNRSNTPLQALTLLNDQAFFEFAQSLAARVLREGPATEPEQIRFAFRLCLAREPRERERQTLERLLAQQMVMLARNPQEARALVPADLPTGIDPTRLAAWTQAARVLLNLDEFITRE
jgi:mono/diheme cytochrome c family protein